MLILMLTKQSRDMTINRVFELFIALIQLLKISING